jgi:hypothetical protein
VRHFFSWVRRVAFWFWIPEQLWKSLLAVVGFIIIPEILGASELSWRLSGLLLQLFGIYSVVSGINSTRKDLGLPTLSSVTKKWIKQFPKYKIAPVVGDLAGRIGVSASMAADFGWTNPPKNATPEERIRVTEQNLEYLRSNNTIIHERIAQLSQTYTELLNKEAAERVDQQSKLKQSLVILGTGGNQISAVGAMWLFVGVILSTLAPELQKWLK